MVLSITLVRTGVMEMGRKSECCLDGDTLGDWKDGSCLSLLWNSGSGKRKVEKPSYWLAEDWSSKPEEPGRKSI